MDAESLARVQFALTISFHYLFPPLTLGLGLVLLVLQGFHLKTGQDYYHQLTRFWMKIFALIFSFGALSGFMMKAEMGTRWATYAHYINQIFTAIATTEAIGSFVVEASLITLLLWGWGRLNKHLYAALTLIAVIIPHFNAAWIVMINSWQQTPQGFQIVGQGIHAYARITDLQAMLFNPSALQRVAHVYTAAWVTGGALLTSMGAYYLRRGQHPQFAKTSLGLGLILTLSLSILHLLSGHFSAVSVVEHQPAKLAAMEGHFNSRGPADLYLVGWVNEVTRQTQGIKFPAGLSLLAHNSFQQPVTGLDQVPRANQPPLNLVFQTYHLMLVLGITIFLLSLAGLWACLTGQIHNSLDSQQEFSTKNRWKAIQILLSCLQYLVFLPLLANQAGWYTAEIGRQPWIVYGLLRTSQGLSAALKANEVAESITQSLLLYVALGLLFAMMLRRQIQQGPNLILQTPISLRKTCVLQQPQVAILYRLRARRLRQAKSPWLWSSQSKAPIS